MNHKVKKVFSLEEPYLGRFTFWIVATQAILVIVLLSISLSNVSRQTARAESQNITNEFLVRSNAVLINELRQNQTGLRVAMIDSMFCMLEVGHDERTGERLEECRGIFLESEAAREVELLEEEARIERDREQLHSPSTTTP